MSVQDILDSFYAYSTTESRAITLFQYGYGFKFSCNKCNDGDNNILVQNQVYVAAMHNLSNIQFTSSDELASSIDHHVSDTTSKWQGRVKCQICCVIPTRSILEINYIPSCIAIDWQKRDITPPIYITVNHFNCTKYLLDSIIYGGEGHFITIFKTGDQWFHYDGMEPSYPNTKLFPFTDLKPKIKGRIIEKCFYRIEKS